MSKNNITLDKLSQGGCAVILNIKNDCNMRRRFQDLGITKGTNIKCLRENSQKDFCIYYIRGAQIAIRNIDAQNIIILI
ncbi:MAG: FeoA family protein [Oscillospiraceae bacterium]